MKKGESKSFQEPDEIREFSKGRVAVKKVGDAPVGRAILQPGWKWSTCVKPIANTTSCQAAHLQYHISGVLHVRMDDGTEFDCKPGEVSYIPPGHDAWVIGNEPVEVIDFQGMAQYAKSMPEMAHAA
jgi:hypothetical protein